MLYPLCPTRLTGEVPDMAIWKKRNRTLCPEEQAKDQRLAEAEKALSNLQHRAHVAVGYLDGRGGRNHWKESVEEMIQGGRPT